MIWLRQKRYFHLMTCIYYTPTPTYTTKVLPVDFYVISNYVLERCFSSQPFHAELFECLTIFKGMIFLIVQTKFHILKQPFKKSSTLKPRLVMLTSVQSAGVAPEVNLRNSLCTGEEACKQGNPPWLWNPGQTLPKVQNRGISGPTKGLVSYKKF